MTHKALILVISIFSTTLFAADKAELQQEIQLLQQQTKQMQLQLERLQKQLVSHKVRKPKPQLKTKPKKEKNNPTLVTPEKNSITSTHKP